jgi:hypothetical protein
MKIIYQNSILFTDQQSRVFWINQSIIKLILWVFIIAILLSSCSHEYKYSIKIKNSTNCHLIGIDFNWCNYIDLPLIDLDSNQATTIFTISYKSEGAFSQGASVCFSIDSVTNGIITLKNANKSGYAIWDSDLSENKVNYFNILNVQSIGNFYYERTTQ